MLREVEKLLVRVLRYAWLIITWLCTTFGSAWTDFKRPKKHLFRIEKQDQVLTVHTNPEDLPDLTQNKQRNTTTHQSSESTFQCNPPHQLVLLHRRTHRRMSSSGARTKSDLYDHNRIFERKWHQNTGSRELKNGSPWKDQIRRRAFCTRMWCNIQLCETFCLQVCFTSHLMRSMEKSYN